MSWEVSECCNAPIVAEDICSACREHCDTVDLDKEFEGECDGPAEECAREESCEDCPHKPTFDALAQIAEDKKNDNPNR